MLQNLKWDVALRGEILGRAALPALLPAWRDLSKRCAEDNVYYGPRYARALLDSVEKNADILFAVVWEGSELVAMLPVKMGRRTLPVCQPAGHAWQTPYTFSCMPLLDSTRKLDAAARLLDVLASISEAEWIIPTINTGGESCRAITAALAQRELPWVLLGQFERAALKAGVTFDQHMSDHVSPKRRKDLARTRRRLEQLGQVEFETYTCGEGLRRAVTMFLDLEASGWKGKRGTALACDEKTKAFAVEAFTGDEDDSICRADVLTLNGTAIAVSLIASAGQTGFTVKCCYDEAYRSCSAGLLLEVEVLRSFLTENWAMRLDAATAGTHVIDDFWPGRTEVADLIFSLSPRLPSLRLSALALSERARRRVRVVGKQCLSSLQRTFNLAGIARRPASVVHRRAATGPSSLNQVALRQS